MTKSFLSFPQSGSTDIPQDMRFYPEETAPFAYEPTRDRFEIIKTDNYGEGIISLASFAVGETVFRFTGELMNEMTLFTLQVEPGMHVHDPYFMGKVLHNCSPNMSADMSTLTFTAFRPIISGDFLTMDYETTEDELWREFICQCGSPECRGLIRGKKFRQPMQPVLLAPSGA